MHTVEVLAGAQAAVTRQLRAHALGYLRAALVPAAASAAVLVWAIEAYWATITFAAGQYAVLIVAGALVVCLSSLAIGRMVRLGLGSEPPVRHVRGLHATAADGRILATFAGLAALAAVGLLVQAGIGGAVSVAFVAPGSELIARPVVALADAAILLTTYYLLGRLVLIIPAAAVSPRLQPAVLWRATEGHAAIAFLVCLAVPAAVGLLIAGPLLWLIGALPWPGPDDIAGAESLVINLRDRIYLFVPLTFFGFLAMWSMISAGLAAAWEALAERGALGELQAAA